MGFLVTSPLLLMAAVFAWWAYRRWVFAVQLAEGTETEGRIVGFERREVHRARNQAPGLSRPSTVQVPVLEFEDQSGQSTRLSGPEGCLGRFFKLGDRVRVRYPVGEPQRAVIVGEKNELIAGAIAVIALTFFLSWLRLNC